jgi:glycosyltransferase involved in cell wall biosynthesis
MIRANLADNLNVPDQKIPACADSRRIRYLDQNAEVGHRAEYETVVLGKVFLAYSRSDKAIPNNQRAPRRVLHVVENLDRGAVENWLLRMLGHARKQKVEIDWTFYCTLEQPGAMDDKARALGARVIHSTVPIGRNVAFVRALRSELRHGGYDVLHCHHDIVSAVYLLAGSGLPIHGRIVHVHNADEEILTPSRWKQRLYREPMRQICLRMADRIVGISHHTLDAFLAGRRRTQRDLVHYYGVDHAPFENAKADRSGFRQGLGLAENARILLFAGRMVPEKNPLFAVDVLAEMHRLDPATVGVFVGAGSLEELVRQRCAELGLDHFVRFLGWRNDVPEVMCVSDWFILPHPEHPVEGFGLAVVEAQLAGLRMLLSRGILDDPLLPRASFRRLPLSDGPKVWANAAMELLQHPAPSRAHALDALRESPFAMDTALSDLVSLHK